MSDQSSALPRRTVLSAGSTLLAGFGLGMGPLASAATAETGHPDRGTPPAELAAYRPVSVSSTDYAPTPAAFAVDGLAVRGVRGSGWRAADGDPQWIKVDLQALCEVSSVRLVFEATSDDPPFRESPTGSPRDNTTGQEILSSCAVAFVIETSRDDESWTAVYRTDSGKGGEVSIPLPKPVSARWVRMTATKRSNTNPLGLNGLQVYGACRTRRPEVTGWTDWGVRERHPQPLKVAADGTVPLESGWDLTMDDRAGADGAALSRTEHDTSRWLPATVPGTVLASLVDQGRLPDPVAGFDNLHAPEALSRHSWWYRREFALPKGLRTGSGRHIWLEFDGVNHTAEVWFNSTRIGAFSNPFSRASYDVTNLLSSDGQALAVKITPMPFPGSPTDKGPAGLAFVDAGATMMNRNSPTYLASSGWDWMPAVRDRAAGIWNHVRLRSTGAAVIGDPRVDTLLPDLPDTGTAELTVVVPVRNADSTDKRVTVTAAFGRVKVTRTVTVPGGKSTDVTFSPADFPQLRLRDPRLWWPNGYGEQNLHDLTLTASVDGRESDRRTTRFGIRQFGYEYGAVPMTFRWSSDIFTQTVDFTRQKVRYVRILCHTRATQWGSSMWKVSVLNSPTPGEDLALGKKATASSSDDPSREAVNVTDGDGDTRWSSTFDDEQWVQVDLGSTVAFDRVAIDWEQAYAKTYTIQVSNDGSAWTDVRAVDNAAAPLPFNTSGAASMQNVEFDAVTARHVRVFCRTRATGWGFSMWDLAVVDSTRPGTNLALRKTATASSEGEGTVAGNAVDGDINTRWTSLYEDDSWIRFDLGAPERFDRVAITWEQAYARTYTIQISDNGTDWKDVKSVDNSIAPLKISVNGVRVFCRGGNWGWDELLRRMPAERMDTAVRMHRDMNFTMIRNWVGCSNREEFYASCDRHGLLVWNDFPNAWAMDPPDHDAFNSTARDVVLRYRIHPSVVVWCGANEGNPPTAIDDGMRDAVHTGAPGVLYQNNSADGIVTGGGPYGWVEPERYFSATTYGQELRLPHRDRYAGGLHGRDHAQPRRRGARVAGRRRLVPPRLEHQGEPGAAELPRGHRDPARHGQGSGRLLPQGPVPQLREPPRHVRGMERPPVGRRERPPAVDVPPRLVQHGVADVRLRLRRQRRLLRRPQGLRARARAGEPGRRAGHRRQPHSARDPRGHRDGPLVRPRRPPGGRRAEGDRGRRGLRDGEGVHRRPARHSARSVPAAPAAHGRAGEDTRREHVLAIQDPGGHAGPEQCAAEQGLGGRHRFPGRLPRTAQADSRGDQPGFVGGGDGASVPGGHRYRAPGPARRVQRQLPVAAARRVPNGHGDLARPRAHGAAGAESRGPQRPRGDRLRCGQARITPDACRPSCTGRPCSIP